MNKIVSIVLFLLIAGLIWFFFVKQYDYEFQFETRYGQGVAFREISHWKELNKEYSKLEQTGVREFDAISQSLQTENARLDFLWNFESDTDSITKVKVWVRSNKDRFKNRFQILNPFAENVFIDSIKTDMLDLMKNLKKQQSAYSVKLEDSLKMSPAFDCICHHSEAIPVQSKAMEMVQTIGYLEEYVLDHQLKLTGNPFVKITAWDRQNDKVNFDFCFPVNLAQDIRPEGKVEFRQVPSSLSLQAVFHGNYRISDLAWYDLMAQARAQNLKTSALPLEIFYNNPKTDIHATQWRADVFLPVIDQP